MPSGSCLCGAVQVSYTGSPSLSFVCHCNGCKKNSGSVFSSNLAIPYDSLRVASGSDMLKTFVKTYTATGNVGVNYFCTNCGTTLWMETRSVPGTRFLKAGIMDVDTINWSRPTAEFFSPNRTAWAAAIYGASQLRTMQ